MKTYLYQKASMILLVILFISCQQNDALQPIDVTDYNQIGVEHNKAMDALFVELKALRANSSTGRPSTSEYLALLESKATSFTLNSHPELSGDAIVSLKENNGKMKAHLENFAKNDSNEEYIHSGILESTQPLLTVQQKKYVDKIMSVTTSATDLDRTLSSLTELEREIRANCGKDELPVLLTSISIARHSSQYWHANYSKWVAEFGNQNSPQSRTKKAIDWGVVGGADLAAGVSVGVATSTALVVPFIGWGAWAAITGGSAALTSAGGALIYALS